MTVFSNFLVSFFFSFVGSVPPATINLIIVQLGLEKKISIAWRFAFAASLIEYPYAWLAVKFESMITSSPVIIENFQLIAAIVMITLGSLSLLTANRPSTFTKKINNSGFTRGIILGLLNPLAIPYWIGLTAYLKSQRWIDLSTNLKLHSYLLGVSVGGFVILIIMAYLSQRIASRFEHSLFLKRIPGITLLILGLYAFMQYLL